MSHFLDIRLDKLCRQIVGIPVGTDCALFVTYLLLSCYERDFMLSLSDENQEEMNDALNSTSRFLDYLLNIGDIVFSTA